MGTFRGGDNLLHSSSAIMASPTHARVTCGTASVTALAANTKRRYALFVNASDSVIYLSVDGGDATTSDLPLAAGAAYEMYAEASNLVTTIVTAISTGATKYLHVSEGE